MDLGWCGAAAVTGGSSGMGRAAALCMADDCARAAPPWLRKAEWARIVNVSAHSTKRQTPTLIGYTAAKSALTSISKNLAKTLAPENILVNTVSPGTFLSGVRAARGDRLRDRVPGVAAQQLYDGRQRERRRRLGLRLIVWTL